MSAEVLDNLTNAVAALREAEDAWTQAVVEALKGNTNKDVSDRTGLSSAKLTTLRKKHEIPSPRGRGRANAVVANASPEVVRTIRDLHSGGNHWTEIANQLNADGHTIPNGNNYTSRHVRDVALNYGIGAKSAEDFINS